MDDTVTSISESADLGATAPAARDRSGDSSRFVEALRAARARNGRADEPPVELRLSPEARKYVEEHEEDEDRDRPRGKTPRRLAYPPRRHDDDQHPDHPDSDRRSHDD